jgi:hypothetical protein
VRLRRFLSVRFAKRYMIGGLCGFVGSLIFIITTLIGTYPCANLIAAGHETFVCRQLGAAQTFVSVLSVIARVCFAAIIYGVCLWLYGRARRRQQDDT